jgi:hypothetical protein
MAGAWLIHGSCPDATYHASPYSSPIRSRVAGSVTTTRRWPWLNPALGARWAAAAIRSRAARGTGSGAKWRTIRRCARTSRNSIAGC